MQILIILYILLLGLVIGCFLNVCIYRIPLNQSIINPPSHCTGCGTRLRPLDLVPVFSYVCLRGKCRYCGEKVSARYPIVESLTAFIFLLLYLKFSISAEFLSGAYLCCILICAAFIDFEHKIIPNGLIIAGLAGGTALFSYNIFYPVSFYGDRYWFTPLLGMVSGAGFLLLVSLAGSAVFKSDDAMGMGDVKILAVAGLFIGWKLTIVCIFTAVLLAAAYSVILIMLNRKNLKSTVPFGPFIAVGTFAAIVCGWDILNYYISNLPM